jgi:predicted Ser/Thr protein kinase
MSSRHERVRGVFIAVSEQAPEERSALLENLCQGDAELRQEVESLLAYHDEPTTMPTLPTIEAPGGKLATGELFAGRYRVIERLGAGGMGEVYRVNDTVLGVEVALKLLRATNPASRDRLINEVRLAREVSHPAVCRVYDVASAGDELFFTMELVTGEDLALLLRRIGRLSPEKVVDIARQLCGGLAAAHARGVLHRDLKPSNVLIDREGRVRLSDFGIATTTAGAGRAEAGGTPGYMAPEQLRADGVLSERTDLYSLALVLCELLIGSALFADTGLATLMGRAPRRPRTTPSQLAAGVPPGLERVLLQALEPDPARRPASALAFARELPGVDSEAIAREAGLPLPSQADGQAPGGLRRWQRRALLALLLAGTLGAADLADDEASLRTVIPRQAPALLVERARAAVRALGYEPRKTGSEHGFVTDPTAPPDQERVLFWYREQGELALPEYLGRLMRSSGLPQGEAVVPGGAVAILDHAERLVLFDRRPLVGERSADIGGSMDWQPALLLAGLDPTTLQAAPADPLVVATSVSAWVGTAADGRKVRVDAAASFGRLVYFAVSPDGWQDLARAKPPVRALATAALLAALLLALIIAAGFLSRRNLRRGDVDRRLAWRLGAVTASVAAAATWLGPPGHPMRIEILALYFGLLVALLLGGAVTVGVLGYQPVVHRAFPRPASGEQSWRWLLSAKGGAALLAGTAFGAVLAVVAVGFTAIGPVDAVGPVLLGPTASRLTAALGPAAVASTLLGQLGSALVEGLLKLVVLALLRVALKRTWAAVSAFILMEVGLRVLTTTPLPAVGALALLQGVLGAFLLIRFGPQAFIVASFASGVLRSLPLTDDLGAWYGPAGLVALIVVLGMGFLGFAILLQQGSTRPRR